MKATSVENALLSVDNRPNPLRLCVAFGRATSQQGAAQRVVTSGTLPPVVRVWYYIECNSPKKISRLMSPFSKDETNHES